MKKRQLYVTRARRGGKDRAAYQLWLGNSGLVLGDDGEWNNFSTGRNTAEHVRGFTPAEWRCVSNYELQPGQGPRVAWINFIYDGEGEGKETP